MKSLLKDVSFFFRKYPIEQKPKYISKKFSFLFRQLKRYKFYGNFTEKYEEVKKDSVIDISLTLLIYVILAI